MADRHPPQLGLKSTESYGASFKADLFAQYTHYVESAEKISERRVAANNYLLTVNASLVTLFGVVASSRFNTYWTILVPVAGLLVSLTWHRIITSYRDLNTVKFGVIHELEKQMPAALYDYEWRKAEQGRGKAYHPLSHLERWVPIIFMILYVLLGIVGSFGLTPGKNPMDQVMPAAAAESAPAPSSLPPPTRGQ